MEPYTYFAEVVRVFDDRTAVFNIELGFDQWKVATLPYYFGLSIRRIQPREKYLVKVRKDRTSNIYRVILKERAGTVSG